MKKSGKAELVLDVALQLLKTEGDFGITMRKVATTAGMSLSNLQYYYKTKDELLKAMADRYFNSCVEQMREMEAVCNDNAEQGIKALLSAFLIHGLEVSEMCRIFREYWAISTRNSAIEAYLKDYYQQVVTIISDILRPAAISEQALSRAVSIFVPFVEGYSITASSMPVGIDKVAEDMTTIIVRLLADNSQ